MNFKELLEKSTLVESDVIPNEQATKLREANMDRRYDLVYEWVKTGKFSKKQFINAVRSFLIDVRIKE